jgi:predicted RNase H-like HicB family nuclease
MLKRKITLTAVYRKVPEGYIAYVKELPGANAQGATIEEARENLIEAVDLVTQANRAITQKGSEEEAAMG